MYAIRSYYDKSAVEPFMRTDMSTESKEQSMVFVQSIWNHIVAGIAEQRNLTANEINQIANSYAVRSPHNAVELKLADAVKYRDELADSYNFV